MRSIPTIWGISVGWKAENGRRWFWLVQQQQPDIVLMDIRMPEMNGLEATRLIVADPQLMRTKVVVLTTFDEDEEIAEAIQSGAAGYLVKDIAPEELRRAVRIVAGGEALLAPAVTRRVMQQLRASPTGQTNRTLIANLTAREQEILYYIGLGQSNDEIAEQLTITPATARTYFSRLLSKLNARDRSQLVILAYESGLIQPGR